MNGKTVMTTQTVVKTRWHLVSGQVQVNFDDTLIVASTSLQVKYVEMLEPFDLHNLVPFDERYLSGMRTEIYQLGVQKAFEQVKVKMGVIIRGHIRSDIGGDEQRIISSHTRFEDVSFKHILLPIWVSSYRYKKKVYRFLINARTGETHGERPYDKWKIAITVHRDAQAERSNRARMTSTMTNRVGMSVAESPVVTSASVCSLRAQPAR